MVDIPSMVFGLFVAWFVLMVGCAMILSSVALVSAVVAALGG